MDLPLLSAFFAALAVTFYVMLDGFDLGVGAMLLAQTDEKLRDRMVESIMPTWDGNETWLIMAGVALFAAFPIAYGLLLPAFYLPLIIMLLALGLRGVSFEFRFQAIEGSRVWDVAFGAGSIVAALMQGLIVGGLLQGIAIDGEQFSGSVFDVFRPFPLLVAVTMLAGYVLLGGGWLHLKTTGSLRVYAERILHRTLPIFLALAAMVFIAAAVVQPGVRAAWSAHPLLRALVAAGFPILGAVLAKTVGGPRDHAPFLSALALFACGIAGLGLTIFPDIVPFRLSLWAAASATSSQLFILTGAAIVTPVVLGYSAFAYYVFRGKTPSQGWEA
jgi:cytochrome d ubiquinol oxidase subunit II